MNIQSACVCLACIYYVYCELNVLQSVAGKNTLYKTKFSFQTLDSRLVLYKKKWKNKVANWQFLGTDFKIANKLLLNFVNFVFWFCFLL